jgi:hypothetical protein
MYTQTRRLNVVCAGRGKDISSLCNAKRGETLLSSLYNTSKHNSPSLPRGAGISSRTSPLLSL